MSWIPSIPPEKATGKLKEIYERIAGPHGKVDHVLSIHGLRPHTLEGHLALYKSTLHHSGNQIPKWFLEALGTYVSLLNGCEYCVTHHKRGIQRNLPADKNFTEIFAALHNNQLELAFNEKEVSAFHYARQLTLQPAQIQPGHISDLLRMGWEAGEILEMNQVVGYFNYANRTVLGLGVSLEE